MSPPPSLPPGPVGLPPSPWSFADVVAAAQEVPVEHADDLIGAGADLEPGTLLAAYRAGVFPMEVAGLDVMGWWSPIERGVLELDALRVSRSLRRSMRQVMVSVDRDFAGVLVGCAQSGRPGDWITPEIGAAYTRLHELGWAHSVEVWSAGALVGGLYGVALGGLFAGESMFHVRTDASKVALAALVEVLRSAPGPALVDVQWRTQHLATLGVHSLPRSAYLSRLPDLVAAPGPHWARWRHTWCPQV